MNWFLFSIAEVKNTDTCYYGELIARLSLINMFSLYHYLV